MHALRLLLLALVAAVAPAQDSAPATLRFRVLQPDGSPIAGAEVRVGEVADFLGTTQPPVVARSEDDGRVTVPLEDAFLQRIQVTAAGRVSAVLDWRLRLEEVFGEDAVPDLVLPPAVPFHGRVRDADGRPLAGAVVHTADRLQPELWGLPMDWKRGDRAVSGRDGIFTLQGSAGGALGLSVQADGCFDLEQEGIDPGSPLDLRPERSGHLAGRVVDGDGNGVPARVAVEYEGVPAETWSATGPDGAFRLTWRERGAARVLVRVGNPPRQSAWSEVLTAPREDLVLRLREPGELPLLRLRVVDAEGQPVAACRTAVFWQDVPEAVLDQMLDWSAPATPTAGMVLLPPPPPGSSVGRVLVVAPGRARTVVDVSWDAADPEQGKDVTVVLVPERVVRGTVRDADGAAVAGALVMAIATEEKQGWGVGGPPWSSVRVRSGDDGSFALGGLRPGEWDLAAIHPLRPGSGKQRITVPAEGDVESTAVELPAQTRLHGVVAGSPPRGSRVRIGGSVLERMMGREWQHGWTVPVAADGAFAVQVMPGSHQIALLVPDPDRPGAMLDLPAGKVDVPTKGSQHDMDFAACAPGVIRGRVTSAGLDLPRGWLAVQAISTATRDDVPFALEAGALRAPVAPDGSFRRHVPPGEYTLSVLDLRTGQELGRAAEPCSVPAAGSVASDVAVTAAEVRVHLRPVAATEQHGFALTTTGAQQHRHMSGTTPLRLPRLPATLRLFVAPGEHTLEVLGDRLPPTPDLSRLLGVMESFLQAEESLPAARAAFVAAAGQVVELELDVPVRTLGR